MSSADFLRTTAEHAGAPRLRLIGRNFSWLVMGNLVYGTCQWGILIVLAKLGSQAQVGQFALGLAVTAPIMLFANLSLSGVLATDVAGDYSFRHYLGLRLITIVAAVLLIGAISIMAWPHTTTGPIVLIIGLTKGIDALSDIFFGLLQRGEMMTRIGIGMLWNGVVSFLAVLVAMALTRQVFWAALASTLGSATALMVVSIPSARLVVKQTVDRRPSFEFPRLLRLATLALPLGIVTLLIALNANLPRYAVDRFLGEGPLGLFAAMAYTTVAAITVIGALGQAATPQMARRFWVGDLQGYVRLIGQILGLALVVGMGAVAVAAIAGRQLLTLLYRADYAVHPNVFLWITVAAAISILASVLSYAMTAARRFQAQALLAAVSLVVTGGACVVLVPRFELLGAAWGASLGAVVQFVGGLGILRSAIRERHHQGTRE